MAFRALIAEMLPRLEEQIAHNAEREAFHAGHEAFRRLKSTKIPALVPGKLGSPPLL